jgi:hypothetical protein
VFACALVALILVVAWWVWSELKPVGYDLTFPPVKGKDQTREGLGVLAFLEAQVAGGRREVPSNPFLPPWAKRTVRRPPPQAESTTTKPADTEKPAEQKTAAKTPPPQKTRRPDRQPPPQKTRRPDRQPPEDKPRAVSLTYRGVFKRPDGRLLALVEDSKQNKSAFYAPGDSLHGLTIGEIRVSEVDVIQSDQSTVSLRLGEPAPFSDGKYAD